MFQVHYPEFGLCGLSDQYFGLQLLADAWPPVVAALGNGKSGTIRPGVDVINVLLAAFTRADPKCTKNTVKPSVFFALFGPTLVKASRNC